MPSDVFSPRFQALLRRVFNLAGPSSLQLDDVVLPVANVWDPGAPELYANRGDRLAWGTALGLGGVGVNAQVTFSNPASSSILAVIYKIYLDFQGTAGPAGISLSIGNGFASAGNEQYTDGRLTRPILGNPPVDIGIPQCFIGNGTGGPGKGVVLESGVLSNTVEFSPRLVVGPGQEVVVTDRVAQAAGNNLRVSFLWYERSVEPTELTVGG